MMNNRKYLFASLVFVLMIGLYSCEKQTEYQLEGELPSSPDFSIETVVDNPNKFLVTDLSDGNYSRVWDFGAGMPATSKLKQDTVFFNKKGTYTITLHIASADGNGTAFAQKDVVVAEDVLGCQIPLLPEDCTTRCWRLSGEPEGVKVGPVPFSGEWYTSPDIVPTQADDLWCFDGDGNFVYNNNGSSFSACQGFIEVEDYPIPSDMTYTYLPGAGFDGFDVYTFSDEIFMGVEDTGPEYNVVSVNETTMTILTPIKPCDGTPSPGWFTLTFYAAE